MNYQISMTNEQILPISACKYKIINNNVYSSSLNYFFEQNLLPEKYAWLDEVKIIEINVQDSIQEIFTDYDYDEGDEEGDLIFQNKCLSYIKEVLEKVNLEITESQSESKFSDDLKFKGDIKTDCKYPGI